jgi:hypothetical protein
MGSVKAIFFPYGKVSKEPPVPKLCPGVEEDPPDELPLDRGDARIEDLSILKASTM